ncbi:MAG: tetratricopeptide repeat protein [Gallionellaceae bacterium]|nr:tetratricopeptide repeat protein [Gallionellaceae bacterium]
MRKQLVTTLAALSLLAWGGAAWANASSDAWLEKGDGQWQAGKPDLAIKSYDEADQADPTSAKVLMKKAGLLLATQNFDSAIRTYQRAIGVDRNNAKAFIGMAIAYLHGGGYDLARAAFEEAIRLEPGRKAQIAPVLANLDEQMKPGLSPH